MRLIEAGSGAAEKSDWSCEDRPGGNDEGCEEELGADG
jgi:hypothetical protein